MKFKEFIQIDEEQSGTDKGLMGYPMAYYARKPSEGRPFKNLLSIAGANPRGGGGGGGGSNNFNHPDGGAGGSGVIILKIPNSRTANFSGGVSQTNSTIGDYKHYIVTAAGVSDTVTFS